MTFRCRHSFLGDALPGNALLGNALRRLALLVAAGLLALPIPLPAAAQDSPGLGMAGGAGVQRLRPDLSDMDRMRFVTDSDYPPFNYLDEDGTLTGFNVDLARALCEELSVECEVRTVGWDGLLLALADNEADAAVASMRTTEKTLAEADFTESYYHTPARFAARRGSSIDSVNPEDIRGVKVGVVQGTTHELFLRDFYPDAEIVVFEDTDRTRQALREGTVDLLFGDGIALMFWLNGASSNACCEFRGEPYLEPGYFGEGIGIAVRRGNRRLRDALEYGLERVRESGRFEELLLRYFPMSVF